MVFRYGPGTDPGLQEKRHRHGHTLTRRPQGAREMGVNRPSQDRRGDRCDGVLVEGLENQAFRQSFVQESVKRRRGWRRLTGGGENECPLRDGQLVNGDGGEVVEEIAVIHHEKDLRFARALQERLLDSGEVIRPGRGAHQVSRECSQRNGLGGLGRRDGDGFEAGIIAED